MPVTAGLRTPSQLDLEDLSTEAGLCRMCGCKSETTRTKHEAGIKTTVHIARPTRQYLGSDVISSLAECKSSFLAERPRPLRAARALRPISSMACTRISWNRVFDRLSCRSAESRRRTPRYAVADPSVCTCGSLYCSQLRKHVVFK